MTTDYHRSFSVSVLEAFRTHTVAGWHAGPIEEHEGHREDLVEKAKGSAQVLQPWQLNGSSSGKPCLSPG